MISDARHILECAWRLKKYCMNNSCGVCGFSHPITGCLLQGDAPITWKLLKEPIVNVRFYSLDGEENETD